MRASFPFLVLLSALSVLRAAAATEPPTPAAVPEGPAASKLAEGDRLRLLEWQQGNALKAIPLYEEALKAGADEYEVRWRIASAYFWAGENVTDAKKLEELGKKGIEQAEKAAALKPDRPEGHYYTAVCWGTYSHGISIPTALLRGVEGKFKSAALKAEKIDPSFENGAVRNALGRFYYELPWPKRDLKKSAAYLKKNLEATPCNLRTRLYYAETILKAEDPVDGTSAKEAAREHLQYVLDHEHCKDNPGDGALSKRLASEILKKL